MFCFYSSLSWQPPLHPILPVQCLYNHVECWLISDTSVFLPNHGSLKGKNLVLVICVSTVPGPQSTLKFVFNWLESILRSSRLVCHLSLAHSYRKFFGSVSRSAPWGPCCAFPLLPSGLKYSLPPLTGVLAAQQSPLDGREPPQQWCAPYGGVHAEIWRPGPLP